MTLVPGGDKMKEQARISERILNDGFGLEIQHNEQSEENQNGTSEFQHYGVLGMKWGIRKDRKRKDETPQEYQARMNRESAERTAKIQAKSKADSERRAIAERAATQRRQLKSQQKIAKMQLKSQEKEKAAIRKSQEKERKKQAEADARAREEQTKQNRQNDPDKKSKTSGGVKSMSDQELRDAILRLRAEKEYQQMMKKPDGFLKKTAKGIGKTGGGMLLSVGKNIAVKQLSDIGNAKADAYLKKKGIKKDPAKEAEDKKAAAEQAWKAQYGNVDSSILSQLYLLEAPKKR